MKKIVCGILALVLLLGMTSCGGSGEHYQLYFADADGKALVTETAKIPDDGVFKKKVTSAVEKLLAGPENVQHTRVIPEGTELLGLDILNGEVYVNFSQEFSYNENRTKTLLAIYSVVGTLCGIDGVKSVTVAVNGKRLRYASDNEEMRELTMNNVITDDEIGKNQTAVITLYFVSPERNSLVTEERTVDIKDNETVEKTVVAELLKGPKQKGEKCFPAEMKLLSIETKDKICYVNFSKEFLTVPEEEIRLAAYSVVNTVTNLRQADFVQFLIEGEKSEGIGTLSLAEPFSYNKTVTDDR